LRAKLSFVGISVPMAMITLIVSSSLFHERV
jgi:hypothetical protein